VLVGINESGKSNILKALASLSPDFPHDLRNVRLQLPDEEQDNESFIRFIFKLDEQEALEVFETSRKKLKSQEDNPLIASFRNKSCLLQQFCRDRCEVLYQVDTRTGKRQFLFWTLASGWKVESRWKVNTSPEAVDILSVTNLEELPFSINTGEVIDGKYYRAANATLTPLDASELNHLVGNCIISVAKKRMHKCVHWQYSPENLLPAEIDADSFAENPDSCVPLYGPRGTAASSPPAAVAAFFTMAKLFSGLGQKGPDLFISYLLKNRLCN
ncbi:MAG TPA: hypothetical protein VGE22_00750, partial [Solimonas sp.]